MESDPVKIKDIGNIKQIKKKKKKKRSVMPAYIECAKLTMCWLY